MHPDGGVETGQPDPMPRPVVAWAADLTDMVNRVATFYEWSNQDRQDFIAWACRSAEGLADARAFIETEAARLPAPGLLDRRRVVLDMLADDPAVHCTWTLDDTGTDPVMLVIAVRDVGTAELAIPRTKFDALALPMLIAKLTEPRQPAAGNT